MSTNTDTSPNDEMPSHRHSFATPDGFNRTEHPPCTPQDAITDAFCFSRANHEPVGYIVVKRLTASNGDVFWSIEEYQNNGDYQKQMTSYGTGEKPEVPGHIKEAAANIRAHTID